MKQGVIIIIEKDGRQIVAIDRNGNIIELPHINVSEVKQFIGQTCSFTGKGDNLTVGGKIFYKPSEEKPIVVPSAPVKTLGSLMRESANNTEVMSNDQDMEDSERNPVGEDSFSLKHACVPDDTKRCGLKKEDCDNFHLKFYRFARFETYVKSKDKYTGEKTYEEKFYFFNSSVIKDVDKNQAIGKLEIRPNFGILPIEPTNKDGKKRLNIAERQKQSVESLFAQNQIIQPIFKPAWRMVVGLGGGASVYEVGMTLHHIYGIPYIPASGIKGVLRSYIIQKVKVFNNSETTAKNGETADSKSFIEIFGTTDNQGSVSFFDAFPITKPKLRPDIMNPHYPKYYSGSEAPTDTQSPVPIPFLTVYNTSFQFLMASKKMDIQQKLWEFEENDVRKRLTLAQWLKKALTEHGIGAKTAVGYGYMKS
jgi:CRISPR-associated protein Cmr6